MDLVKAHKKFEGKIKYAIVCTEKHQDGEEHKHVLVMLLEPIYISRVDCEAAYDLFKEWRISENGECLEGSLNWKWLRDHFRVDYIDEYPKAGMDIKDEGLESCYYRRFHCNIEGVHSPKGSIEYVKKDGDFIEIGKGPVKKMTKKEKNELLQSKPLIDLVADGDISIYHVNALKRARETLENESIPIAFGKRIVRWFCGPTGVGKTKEAWEEALKEVGGDIDQIWISHTTSQWYDGYHGQTAVIIDDIRSSSWPFQELLRITDRYPIEVPVKGGFRRWNPKHIWITAPGRPEQVYCDHESGRAFDGIEQLHRRITELREYDEPSINPEDQEEIDSFIQKVTTPKGGPDTTPSEK